MAWVDLSVISGKEDGPRKAIDDVISASLRCRFGDPSSYDHELNID